MTGEKQIKKPRKRARRPKRSERWGDDLAQKRSDEVADFYDNGQPEDSLLQKLKGPIFSEAHGIRLRALVLGQQENKDGKKNRQVYEQRDYLYRPVPHSEPILRTNRPRLRSSKNITYYKLYYRYRYREGKQAADAFRWAGIHALVLEDEKQYCHLPYIYQCVNDLAEEQRQDKCGQLLSTKVANKGITGAILEILKQPPDEKHPVVVQISKMSGHNMRELQQAAHNIERGKERIKRAVSAVESGTAIQPERADVADDASAEENANTIPRWLRMQSSFNQLNEYWRWLRNVPQGMVRRLIGRDGWSLWRERFMRYIVAEADDAADDGKSKR